MARGIPAIVTPEVLQWARDLDRITIDEIAQKLNVDAAKVDVYKRQACRRAGRAAAH